ncbi:hypothetical protein L1987_45770 [Smallanthus sonchifolius]|uniref:Uncharacterized protein n=1 Tax=Smallanthus sonchifolius TaxID=185202 RepID=A0ACB9FY21_9ASTR|nr:hypothetical protein L1987_45770 [Smallanthus sonchifolius]
MRFSSIVIVLHKEEMSSSFLPPGVVFSMLEIVATTNEIKHWLSLRFFFLDSLGGNNRTIMIGIGNFIFIEAEALPIIIILQWMLT